MLLRRAREDAQGYAFPTGLILAWILPILIGGAIPLFISREDWAGEPVPPAVDSPAGSASAAVAATPVGAALEMPALQTTAHSPGPTMSTRAASAPTAGALAGSAPDHATPPRGIVATGGAAARLRQAPSLEAGVVSLLADGTEVRVLGERTEGDRVWREVTSPSGDRGWIDQTLLR